jgi:hypothetical protein
MANILQYLQDDGFQPNDIKALDDLWKELKLDGNANAKETIAVRISSWHDAVNVAQRSCAIEF